MDGTNISGQSLNIVSGVAPSLEIPICDCSTPFAVNVITDGGLDLAAANLAATNRGKILLLMLFLIQNFMNISERTYLPF
jgi:hypothetical protein